jgi:lysozyme
MSRLKKGAALFAAAVMLIGGYEGVRTVAYRDVVGVPTICFGETRGVKMGDTATMEQCKEMLGDALVEWSSGLDKCLTRHVPDKPYIAFLSWSYNVGLGAACKSTLVRKANAGDVVGACNELLKWDKAGGRVIGGLTKRRQDERRLCLEGLA